jgi:hypothetical protein
VAFTVGFVLNAEYVGWKSNVVIQSYNNIFNQIHFEDPGVLEQLYGIGRYKIFAFNGYPNNFKVIEEAMMAEEWYWVKYSYTVGEEEKLYTNIDKIRIRWKPWEYYFDDEGLESWDEAKIRQYIDEGTLNSNESDRAFGLMYELKEIERKKRDK